MVGRGGRGGGGGEGGVRWGEVIMRGNRLKLQVRVGNQGQRTAAEKQAAVDQLLFCPGGLRTLGTLARQQLSGGGSEENRVGGGEMEEGRGQYQQRTDELFTVDDSNWLELVGGFQSR